MPMLLRWAVLLPSLLYAGVQDHREQVIDNRLSYSLLLLALLLPLWSEWDLDILEVVAATVGTFSLCFLLWSFGQTGGGDVKLYTALAAFFGYAIFLIVSISFLITGLTLIPSVITRRVRLTDKVAMAPGIALGTFLVMLLHQFS